MHSVLMKNKQFISVFILYFIVLWVGELSSSWAGQPASYPVPPETAKSLFYLQRSTNSNTVVYDANLLANSEINPKQPVEIYWLRYNTNGARRDLNFAERNLVYGLNFDAIAKTDAYVITLMAYSSRVIIVSMGSDGKAIAKVQINGKISKLKNIYIDVSGSGFFSSVNYIELIGIDLASGKSVIERFQPEEELEID